MDDSPDPVETVADHLRAAIETLNSEDEGDLSKCERRLKTALDTLTELLEPVPVAASGGKVSLAASLGLETSKVRAAHG